MSKVPFRIYRLKKNSDPAKQTGFTKLAPSKYLMGLDVTNIFTNNNGIDQIQINNSNFPSGSITPPFLNPINFTVEKAGIYGRYIQYENSQYFIYGSEPKDNSTDNVAVPNMFEFYLDPQHITPTYRKLQTEVRTRGGWEIQHWGEALTEVRVQGRSGGMHQLSPGKPLGKDNDITESLAWIRLNQLKALYDSDHNVKNQADTILLGMNYFDRYFIGYFTDFTGPEAQAENPYIVEFSFTFKVQQELSVNAASLKGLSNI